MNVEEIREYCIIKKGVTESFPFNDTALVFKVADKMFALLNLEDNSINLKCDPELALDLREEHSFIRPGYHMNKKHWNTVDLFDAIPTNLLTEIIDHSYSLVYAKLSKKMKATIE